jgi:cell division protein FtsL
MTVIQPNKNKNIIQLIVGVSIVLVLFAVSNVMLYSKSVGLTHDINQLKNKLDALQIKNADLKNALYQETNSEALEKLAADRGMIQDKNPQWALASQQ